MIRRAFFTMVGVSCALLVLNVSLQFGPSLEMTFAPTRVNNENLRPTRSPDRICWTWSSDKLKAGFSDDMDIHLDILDATSHVARTFVPPFFNALTELPWQSGLSIALGHVEIPYCIEVPRTVLSSDRLKVRFTPNFHGWMDLWQMRIETPDMVDPPWAQAPL